MTSKKINSFWPLLFMVAFVCTALSCKLNAFHYGAFKNDNEIEDKSLPDNYLVKNDGTKVYGEKIFWARGAFVKDKIKIDNQEFKIGDIKAFRGNDVYFARVRNQYIKRIIHGKINVYEMRLNLSSTSTNSRTGQVSNESSTRTDYYSQVGEDGPLSVFGSLSDIKKLVADCPSAVEMANLGTSKLKKAVIADRNYLNSIFDIYNNGCKKSK